MQWSITHPRNSSVQPSQFLKIAITQSFGCTSETCHVRILSKANIWSTPFMFENFFQLILTQILMHPLIHSSIYMQFGCHFNASRMPFSSLICKPIWTYYNLLFINIDEAQWMCYSEISISFWFSNLILKFWLVRTVQYFHRSHINKLIIHIFTQLWGILNGTVHSLHTAQWMKTDTAQTFIFLTLVICPKFAYCTPNTWHKIKSVKSLSANICTRIIISRVVSIT